jgi:hypothetical protein
MVGILIVPTVFSAVRSDPARSEREQNWVLFTGNSFMFSAVADDQRAAFIDLILHVVAGGKFSGRFD